MKNKYFLVFVILSMIISTLSSPTALVSATSSQLVTATLTPTPVSPSGKTADDTPSYKWTVIPGATYYRYQLYKGTTLVYFRMATSAACGTTYCSHSPSTSLSLGSYKWRVQAYIGAWKVYSAYKFFSEVSPVPTLVSPSGKIIEDIPSYKWNKVVGATQYRYQLFKGTSKIPVFTKTVSSTACGTTFCTNTPLIPLALGKYKWHVQAYVGDVWKTYSPYKFFSEIVLLWTSESGEGLLFVEGLVNTYSAAHPDVIFTVVSKDTETLRNDFIAASSSGNPPDLLLTVSDHFGQFVPPGYIKPVETLFDMSKYVDCELIGGHCWGVPFSTGNHLMLLYNKSLVPTPPADTYELRQIGISLTAGDIYGFAYNELEPFWLVPWLGGYGGKVFAADGVTPTLNTTQMINSLQWLYDLKYTHQITPLTNDYNSVDTLFKQGKVGMIVNGDWSLADYENVMGANLGVVPLPENWTTGLMPAPYTAGKYFMLPSNLSGGRLTTLTNFIKFVTNLENQTSLVTTLYRLPGLLDAFEAPAIQNDPILKNSAAAFALGTPMPTVPEMRCVWDSLKVAMQAVLVNPPTNNPTDAAAGAQTAAEACIAALP